MCTLYNLKCATGQHLFLSQNYSKCLCAHNAGPLDSTSVTFQRNLNAVRSFDQRHLLLVQAAERHSLNRTEGNKPGTEHFVLAAIESKDGAAKEVFRRLGLDADDFEDALREQYKNSLKSIGIEIDNESLRVSDDSTPSDALALPRVTESGRELLRVMSQQNRGRAFSGADVLRALNKEPEGPAHRALVIMGTTADKIVVAAGGHESN